MRGLLVFVLFLLWPVPALAEWHEATSRHFVIFSEGRPESLREFAIKVERFDALLRERLGVPDAEENPPRLTIFMLRDQRQVARIAKQGRYVAGIYMPRTSGSYALVHRDPANSKFDLGADEVLFHEYAHHFMLRYFPVAYPAWYVEGFAEFMATTDFTPDGRAKIGMPPYYRAYGLAFVSPIAVRRMLTAQPDDFDEVGQDAFYGHSWVLTHYLNFEPARTGQLPSYLKALNAGEANLQAAGKAFGDLDRLDKDLRAYRSKSKLGYREAVRPTEVKYMPVIRKLDNIEGDLVKWRIAAMDWPEAEEAAKLAAQLKSEVEAQPSALGWRLLAEAQYLADQLDAADKSADLALALAPGLARAKTVKAHVAMRRYEKAPAPTDAMKQRMRSLIVAANRADPDDPLPLLAYFRMFELIGERPTKVARDGLARAYQIVPESEDVRIRYAMSLANEQQFDAAIRLMETIAFAPHGGESAQQATQMIERLRKAKSGDMSAMSELR